MSNNYLNFMVKSTCQVLGITFEGTTDEERMAFIEKHREDRSKAINKLLEESYREMVNE